MSDLLDIYTKVWEKRAAFRELVEGRFRELNIKAELADFFVHKDIGRVWRVRHYRPGSTEVRHVPIPAEVEPYSVAAYEAIIAHMTPL